MIWILFGLVLWIAACVVAAALCWAAYEGDRAIADTRPGCEASR